MTVEISTTKVTALGNDAATVFSFSPLIIFETSDLLVTHIAADGTETVLSEGTAATNYSVTLSQSLGTGSITYPASGAAKLPTGAKLVMKRQLPIEQKVNLENQGGYYPDTQEEALDRAAMVDLQQQEEIDRCVKVGIGSSTDPDALVAELQQIGVDAAAALTGAETAQAGAETAQSNAIAAANAAAISAASVMWRDVEYLSTANSPITINGQQGGHLLIINATTGNVTATLPAIANVKVDGATWPVGIRKSDSSANTITVSRDPSSTDTINGQTSFVLTAQNETVSFVADDSATPDDWTAIINEGPSRKIESLIVACSDEVTPITAGAGKMTFRMPYAFHLTEAPRASLTVAQASGSIFTVDINEGGASILGAKLTIDNTEKTSKTAETAATVTDADLADDAEMTIDVDQLGDGTAKGLKIVFIGYQP